MNKLLADILERPVPKELTITKVKNLIQDVAKLDEQPKLIYSSNGEKILNELDQYGVKDIPQNYRGVLLEHWLDILLQTQETTTEIPEYVSTTTLTPDQIANFDKDIERIKKSEQIRADQKDVTEKFEKRNKEIYAEQQRIQNEIKEAEAAKEKLKGKVVYAKVILPEPLPLDEFEKKDLETLRQYAQDESVPEQGDFTKKQVLIETLTKEIEVKIKPLMSRSSEEDVTKEARTLAVQIVKEIADPKYVIENRITSAVYYSIEKDTQTIPQILQKDDELLNVAKKGSTLILLDELEKNDFKHQLLQNLVGRNIAKAIEGPEFDEIQVILSANKTDSDFNEISFDSINTNYELSLKQKSELIDKVQEIGIDKTRDLISNSVGAPIRSIASEKIKVLQKAGKLPASPGLDGIFAKYGIGTSPEFTYKGFGEYVKRFAPETTPYWKLAQEVTGISFGIGVASNVIPLTFGGGIQVGKIVAIQQISIAKAPFTYAIATGNKIAIGAGAKAAGQVAVKAGLATTLSTTLAAWGASVPVPVLNAALAAAGWAIGAVLGKVADKLKDWWTRNKDSLGPALAVGSGLGGAVVFGAGPGLGIGLFVAGTTMGFGTLAAGTFGVLGFIGRSIGIAIATPVIVTFIIIPPLVAFIMLVINNSAYVVPPSPIGGDIINIPPGGNMTKCDPLETGDDITQELANSMKSGFVQLLPNNVLSRQEGLCITPTMIVLHTSGGYDNDDGNTRTYEWFANPSHEVSCQMSTDTNDTILMLNFFQNKVENAWCADNLNAGGVSIEFSGECQGKDCAQVSKCSPNTNLTFTPDGPHPCAPEEDLGFDAVCKVMQKYGIPWTQVFQHEQSSGSHTDPEGDAWSDQFILRLKNNCTIKPNDNLR